MSITLNALRIEYLKMTRQLRSILNFNAIKTV